MSQRLISCAFLLVIGVLMVGCGTAPQPSPTVKSLTVAGTAPTVGAAKQFTVTATFTDGTSQDVTNQPGIAGPYWSSSSTAVATVSSTGMVTGVAPGSVTIQARYKSFTNNVTVQIN